ncbi:MAG: DNRLRE domain-containing protein [Planctomycetes bacterium]|nr:DNRLRE domain-containing protein [Planctomycetota bacterium]
MADAPLLYLRMEETAGPVAFNTANPGANAIYANAPALGQSGPGSADGMAGFGPTNNAVGLDGIDDTVEILPLAVSGNAARTYEGWFNGTESEQAYLSITGGTGRRTSITAANDEVSMAVNGHRFGVTFNSTNIGSPQSNIFTPEELAPGWHHFAITLPDGATRSNEFEFIVDGVDVTPYARTLAGSAKTVNTLSDFGRLGATDTGLPMAGTVDEFAVYDRDLGWQGVADHFGSAHNDLATITQNTFDPSLLQSVAIQSHDQWPDTPDNTDRSDILRVRERTTGGSNQEVRTRSFFEFDLSELEGEQVLGAMLILNQDSRNTNTAYLTLGRVTDDWTEGTVAFDQAFADEFTFGGTNTSATGDDKVSWIDVTDIVSGWVDGTEENHGFRLALRDRGFYIADFYDSGPLAPQLIVTTMAVPEPAGLALLALGGMLLLVFWRRKGSRAANSLG